LARYGAERIVDRTRALEFDQAGEAKDNRARAVGFDGGPEAAGNNGFAFGWVVVFEVCDLDDPATTSTMSEPSIAFSRGERWTRGGIGFGFHRACPQTNEDTQ
jgi:hypothetical protein